MSDRIAYLFGAGASYHAFPLNHANENEAGLTQDLRNVSDGLLKSDHPIHNKRTADQFRVIEKAANIMREVSIQALEFDSIDDLAKDCIARNSDSDYEKVKVALDLYFLFKERFSESRERRYHQLLLKLMNENKFSRNVWMFSWNYDFELGYAFERLGKLAPGYDINLRESLVSCYPFVSRKANNAAVEPRVFHLNGLAGKPYLKSRSNYLYYKKEGSDNSSFIEAINDVMNDSSSLLSFGFDQEGQSKSFVHEKIDQIFTSTDTLIVIGYSFPFYNRETDSKILESFNDANKQIVIQNPEFNEQEFREDYGLANSKISIRKDVREFHVPYSFNG